MNRHETGPADRGERIAALVAMLLWMVLVAGGVVCLVLRLTDYRQRQKEVATIEAQKAEGL